MKTPEVEKKRFLMNRIEELIDEKKAVEKEVKKRDDYISSLEKKMESVQTTSYAMLGESVRLRRLIEIHTEKEAALRQEVESQKKRAEKAERGIRNLQKWMEIQGVTDDYLGQERR